MEPTKEERLARLAVVLTMKSLVDSYAKDELHAETCNQGIERINLSLLELLYTINTKPINKRVILKNLSNLSAQIIRFMVELVLSKHDDEEIK